MSSGVNCLTRFRNIWSSAYIKILTVITVTFGVLITVNEVALANDLSVSNVAITSQSTTSKTANIRFDISWENSWKNNANHDAVWLFAKYSIDSGSTWNHATLKTAGSNPSGFSVGTGTAVRIFVPSDRKGAFVERSQQGNGTVSVTGLEIVWDYDADGLTATDRARVRVYSIEMIKIPAGSFFAGDQGSSTASLVQGSADTDPWQVLGSGAISVSNSINDGYYYKSAGNASEKANGSNFTIPAEYPNGYDAFYVQKYELTEGQWIEFFNTLTDEQKTTRDITSPTGKNSDGIVNRNTIAWTSGDASSQRYDRPMSYLSWMDAVAYADWAAVRPMTELEFEKAARGIGVISNAGEYAWGSTVITAATTISGAENGTETVLTSGANAVYNTVAFAGGDGGQGPLRSGIFANSESTRLQSGAGFYGAMELSGNLSERVISIGNNTGLLFVGSHGDGVLTTTSNYEGNATNTDWPGIDTFSDRGVTGANGSGYRGGSWSDLDSKLKLSDRSQAALIDSSRNASAGFRVARSSS